MSALPKVGDSIETIYGHVGKVVRLGKTVATIHVKDPFDGFTFGCSVRFRDLKARCVDDKTCGCCGWRETV